MPLTQALFNRLGWGCWEVLCNSGCWFSKPWIIFPSSSPPPVNVMPRILAVLSTRGIPGSLLTVALGRTVPGVPAADWLPAGLGLVTGLGVRYSCGWMVGPGSTAEAGQEGVAVGFANSIPSWDPSAG